MYSGKSYLLLSIVLCLYHRFLSPSLPLVISLYLSLSLSFLLLLFFSHTLFLPNCNSPSRYTSLFSSPSPSPSLSFPLPLFRPIPLFPSFDLFLSLFTSPSLSIVRPIPLFLFLYSPLSYCPGVYLHIE